MKTITVNSITYFAVKTSKYAYTAYTDESAKNRIASAPSIPKLKNALLETLKKANTKLSSQTPTTISDKNATATKEKSNTMKKSNKTSASTKLAKTTKATSTKLAKVTKTSSTKLAKGKKTTKLAKVTKTKSEKPKKTSLRKLTLDLMMAGKDDETILKRVENLMKEENREVKYDMSHVKWYRSRFTTDGILPAEFAPKKSKAHKEWLEEQGK